jgi:hypothetical protein
MLLICPITDEVYFDHLILHLILAKRPRSDDHLIFKVVPASYSSVFCGEVL